MSRPNARRVVIDATALADGSQYRGIGTYLRKLLEGLSSYDDLDPVVMATGPTQLPAGLARIDVSRRVPARWRSIEQDWRLPADITRSGAAVFHSPAQSPPRRSAVPWVQTLHDLTPLVFRHPLLAADRRRWERVGPRLRSAGAVICVSESSADQARRLLGVDPARLHVVPLGVDERFGPDGPLFPGGSQFGGGPYLLWVSSWGPHKGLEIAADVVARLAAEGRPHRLVVVGYQDAAMARHVRAAVAPAAAADRVEVLGHVSDLAPLYRGAAALLVTSRAEGFGLPAAEAMACGCPVVCFANTSLPEVVGDGGLLVDDGDVDGYVAAVRRILDDHPLVEELRTRGISRARQFTWHRTIEQHVAVYRSLLPLT